MKQELDSAVSEGLPHLGGSGLGNGVAPTPTKPERRFDEPVSLPNSARWQNDAFSFWKLPEAWREVLEPTLAASQEAAEWFLLERYKSDEAPSLRHALGPYYALKSFMPRRARHFINSIVIRMRRRQEFPKWPREEALCMFWRDWLLASLKTVGVSDGWHIGFWPHNRNCCIVLTHDVESRSGFELMERFTELEDRYGFRSAWNLPLDQYQIDWRLVDKLRAQGFEFGAHGLRHDGMLFRDRRRFLALAPRLESLARTHGLRGFRSPSTHRRAEWIRELDFDFDCSFADTDPYEPQPGGCCSVFPFFNGTMVELPYTLAQDHTLINVLHREPLPLWKQKINWVASLGGMILTLVHPDYSGAPPHLHAYEELLKRLNDLESSWRALPSQVALWWRRRAQLRLCIEGGSPTIAGPHPDGAVARRLSAEPALKVN